MEKKEKNTSNSSEKKESLTSEQLETVVGGKNIDSEEIIKDETMLIIPIV